MPRETVKKRLLLVAVVLAALTGCSDASGQNGAESRDGDALVLTGAVTTGRFEDVSRVKVEKACWEGDWYEDCDIRGEDSVPDELVEEIVVRYADEIMDGKACRGSSNVSAGSEVLITDESGVVIGVSTVRQGTVDSGLGSTGVGSFEYAVRVSVRCVLSFTVPLTESATFYSLSIDGRRGQTFSHDELERLDWHLDLK